MIKGAYRGSYTQLHIISSELRVSFSTNSGFIKECVAPKLNKHGHKGGLQEEYL